MFKRLSSVFLFFIVGFVLLSGRLFYLGSTAEYTEAAKKQSSYSLTVASYRGGIYDRNLTSFVNRQETLKAVCLPEPEAVEELKKISTDLSQDDILSLMKTGKPFISTISEEISDENMLCTPVFSRYSDIQPAAHVIGYLNAEGAEGLNGIERAFNDFLNANGSKVSYSFSVDGIGRFIKGADKNLTGNALPKAGVVLTLDKGIQEICESRGSVVNKGAIVVLDAKSSEILALASFPSFSPNNLGESVNDTILTPMINRCLCPFAVGSTFKIATAAAALEAGISPGYTYTCTGSVNIGGQVFKCHNLAGHGTLDMKRAMAESCNTYYINLAMQTGGIPIRNMASDLGFGKEIPLADGIASSAGVLPSPGDLINPAEVANLSFGQGLLTATPLQLARAFCSITQNGKVSSPSLLLGTTQDSINIDKTENISVTMTAMSEKTAKTLQDFLYYAVMGNDGQLGKPSTVSASGKTATAQTGHFDKDGKEIDQAWFVGYFPAEEPKYVALVLVEDGEGGNASAGPIFAKIADDITTYDKARQ